MKTCNLRDPDDPSRWRSDASAKIFAFMVHPNDDRLREQFFKKLLTFYGGKPLDPSSPEDVAFQHSYHTAHSQGCQVGQLFLTIIQLSMNGIKPSLNKAIELQCAKLGPYEGHIPGQYRPNIHVGHLIRKRSTLLELFQKYRSVICLWASHVYALEVRETPFAGDVRGPLTEEESLAFFVGHAKAFWKLYQNCRGRLTRDGVPILFDHQILRLNAPAPGYEPKLVALRHGIELSSRKKLAKSRASC